MVNVGHAQLTVDLDQADVMQTGVLCFAEDENELYTDKTLYRSMERCPRDCD